MIQCYSEICPQCRRGLDGTLNRLVADSCGHSKCRFCLLQETSGCLKCSKGKETTPMLPSNLPPRPSVIMTTGRAEKHEETEEKNEENTKQMIQNSLNKDILFPTQIVKQNSSGFYHLKRLISKRYYSEGGGREDKNCGTDPQPKENSLPSHIVRFCIIHGAKLGSDDDLKNHQNCKSVCETCGKICRNLQKLKLHRRIHLMDKFVCGICFTPFRDKYALRAHDRVHSGEKIFKCDICQANFKQLKSLKRHVIAHSGEKPFRCEHCDYRALSNEELSRHLLTHSSTKEQFPCPCGLSFSQKRALLRHRKTHHNPSASPITCHCGVTFKRKDNLVRHQKNTHHDGKDLQVVKTIEVDQNMDSSGMTTVFEFEKKDNTS